MGVGKTGVWNLRVLTAEELKREDMEMRLVSFEAKAAAVVRGRISMKRETFGEMTQREVPTVSGSREVSEALTRFC